MTLGSLFDGIAGFPLAAAQNGIKTIWASEIVGDCIDIVKKHFPEIQHLGDITKINGGEIPPVDIISFGSPCQNLSTAGNQKGLDGEKSQLFFEAIRIIYEMRGATNGKYPKYIIWENVAGAFSSNKGQDFRRVLEEITKTYIPMPNSRRWATSGMVRSAAGSTAMNDVDRCLICGEIIPEGSQVCTACRSKYDIVTGETEEMAQELRDVADVLKITEDTDTNIRKSMESILRIADRLERTSNGKKRR